MLTIAAFVFVLGVLIFVHELGHFLAAKAVRIGVPRFSIGFGPPTPLRFRRAGTEYLVSWVPLGGYVKMASREEQEAMAALEGGELEEVFAPDELFESKPLWARILVISAGVIMNVLFAWAVYAGLALVYGRTEDPSTTVARVEAAELPETAAELAEVPAGTRILRVGGDEVGSWDEVVDGILEPRSERLLLELAGSDPIVLEIPGTEVHARAAVSRALVPFREARVSYLVPDSPAAAAGLEPGDLIVAVDGEAIVEWQDLVDAIEPNPGAELVLSIDRRGERIEIPVTAGEESVADPETGDTRTVGRIGVSPFRKIRFGFWEALAVGGGRTWDNTVTVLFALKGMLTGRISPKELGGPILIGQASGQFARAGFVPLLLFMAFLSVNLAVLNLLPIPVLDGGHLVFLFLEGLRGRPLTLEVRQRLTQVGLVVILGIMVLALGNDLLRLVTGGGAG